MRCFTSRNAPYYWTMTLRCVSPLSHMFYRGSGLELKAAQNHESENFLKVRLLAARVDVSEAMATLLVLRE